jgi:UDP-2,3-diacylglucosamine pyrophosphatase LpxH
MVNRDYEKWIAVPDLHAPYEDEKSVSTVLNFIAEQKPDHIVFLGDVIDMYAVSRFDKDPARANQLQDEIDGTQKLLRKFRKAAGESADMTYIEGNHEERMKKYLWRHPELHGLKTLEIPKLLDLESVNIKYVQELMWKDTFLFTHGTAVVKYSAQKELANRGVSGMSGHVHRIQSYAHSDYTGTKAWYAAGHLCDLDKAEYIKNPDWQQALGIVHFSKKNTRFFAEVIPIVEHKLMYGGKVYAPTV